MRTAGIIAEYNPFHNGHAWQIAELKKRGFEAVVCVCSPGVVQRGTAALSSPLFKISFHRSFLAPGGRVCYHNMRCEKTQEVFHDFLDP